MLRINGLFLLYKYSVRNGQKINFFSFSMVSLRGHFGCPRNLYLTTLGFPEASSGQVVQKDFRNRPCPVYGQVLDPGFFYQRQISEIRSC